jgi:hypothetical protein
MATRDDHSHIVLAPQPVRNDTLSDPWLKTRELHGDMFEDPVTVLIRGSEDASDSLFTPEQLAAIRFFAGASIALLREGNHRSNARLQGLVYDTTQRNRAPLTAQSLHRELLDYAARCHPGQPTTRGNRVRNAVRM